MQKHLGVVDVVVAALCLINFSIASGQTYEHGIRGYNHSFLSLYDAKTRKLLGAEVGAIITTTCDYWEHLTLCRADNQRRWEGRIIYELFDKNESEWTIKDYTVTVSAAGYETAVNHGRLNSGVQDGSEFKGHPDIEIYLVPKLEVIGGEISITPPTQQETGVLATEQVAKSLGVDELEILKLIKMGKLKGKQIGSKYFVSREELKRFIESR